MKKNTLILITGIIITLILAGIALGTGLTGLIVKTEDTDFKQDPGFYKALANHFAEQGEYDEAIPAYETSLALGEDREVRNNLAVLYHTSGDYTNAVNHLRILAEQYPENPSYHYDLAVNLVDRFRNSEEQEVNDLLEALAEYELVEQISPGYQNAKQNAEVLRGILKI